MTTQVLDLVTMGHALNELSATYLGNCQWRSINDEQRLFLEWYAAHRDEISKLGGLEALASWDYAVLNSFLQARGFNPMLEPFDGVGVVSILDMLVEWITTGTPTTITRYQEGQTYPAFKIPSHGVTIYDVANFAQPLACLATKSGHKLWLMWQPEPASGLQLANMAQQVLAAQRIVSQSYKGVKVPMLEIDATPDLSWMLGLETGDSLDTYHRIVQALQQFKLRVNQQGARVKVATAFATTRVAAIPGPPPLVFGDPFMGFFTQQDNETLPVAAFWADTDSWREPAGTLEEL